MAGDSEDQTPLTPMAMSWALSTELTSTKGNLLNMCQADHKRKFPEPVGNTSVFNLQNNHTYKRVLEMYNLKV